MGFARATFMKDDSAIVEPPRLMLTAFRIRKCLHYWAPVVKMVLSNAKVFFAQFMAIRKSRSK